MGEGGEGRQHPGSVALLRLLQLASPALPVGAYSYSQGVERAVEDGRIVDEGSAARWIGDVLRFTLAPCEGACLLAMMAAAHGRDEDRLAHLNAWFLASRESAELRAETVQLGHSLRRLCQQLDAAPPLPASLAAMREPAYPCVWACVAEGFGLVHEHAHAAYLWAWAENQVLAAVKLVPLGQSAGQRILLDLGGTIAGLVAPQAQSDEQWINFAPGLALASVAHETQYTRLFRS